MWERTELGREDLVRRTSAGWRGTLRQEDAQLTCYARLTNQACFQALPFPDNSFDCYTIAFGIRNVVQVDSALKEAYRVLKPGGRFLCLEFSSVTVPGLDALYDLYSFQVIPPLGHIIAGDWQSYQYLVESIRQFPDQESFLHLIRDAGFGFVKYENLTGGIAALHSGFKL